MKSKTLTRLEQLERSTAPRGCGIVYALSPGCWSACFQGRRRDFPTMEAAAQSLTGRADPIVIIDI